MPELLRVGRNVIVTTDPKTLDRDGVASAQGERSAPTSIPVAGN